MRGATALIVLVTDKVSQSLITDHNLDFKFPPFPLQIDAEILDAGLSLYLARQLTTTQLEGY